MSTIRVVAAVVDTRLVTLYEEGTGQAYEIPQGDPRVQQIVDKVLPVVQQGLVAEFLYEAGPTNPYRDFQEESGGLVRFFRVAKQKLANLFAGSETTTAEIGAYGNLPVPAAPAAEGVEALGSTAELTPDMSKAVSEIISNAEPVTDRGFSDRHTTDDHTIIAVTGKGKDQRILPGVEKIKGQFAHAAKLGSTQGVTRLIERLTAIAPERRHSVEDVLRFLEKGDLPVADDGTIIAYKRLYSRNDKQNGAHFVDPHTRSVRQKIGSYVCLDPKMVDWSRAQECSNGLHIGRRAYMGSFSGDAITLCKIDPEDVIVVPHGDPNKVRVCGYHIIAQLGDAEFRAICQNRPMTDTEKAQSLLARAIRGEHIGRTEEVRIVKQGSPTTIEVTPLENGKKPAAKGKVEAPNAMALDDERVLDPDPKRGPAATADVKQVIDQVTPTPAPATPTPEVGVAGGGRVQKMRSLYTSLIATKDPAKRQSIAQEAAALKKSAKIGWQTFGLTEAEAKIIIDTAAQEPAQAPSPTSAPEPASDPLPAAADALRDAGEAFAKAEGLPVEQETITGAPDAPPAGKFDRKVEAKRLFDIAADIKQPVDARRQALIDLNTLKRKSKVSWSALGLNGDRVISLVIKAEPAAAPAPRPQPNAHLKKTAEAGKRMAEAKKTTPAKAPAPVASTVSGKLPSKAEVARGLFREGKWDQLHAFKKAAKKGWHMLGFTPDEEKKILANKP